ncbi:MAG: ATP phosphoribosyltransferase [Christensenellales bacterium]|jgi:ATP phosphoribosyltransferase
MIINDAILQNDEKIVLELRTLYASKGYRAYRMSKFEEYDLYAGNKDFLVSDNVITFTDPSGRLMALRPDVTLSIIKNSADAPEDTQKIYYSENIYRPEGEAFREIMQIGVECFGSVDAARVREVILLAAESLSALSPGWVLDISDLDILGEIVAELNLSSPARAKLYRAIGGKNAHEIEEICAECENRESVQRLLKLASLRGNVCEVSGATEGLSESFADTLRALAESPFAKHIYVDFSVVCDPNYYNGIVFKGFINGLPESVLSGGQYDNLMRRMKRKSSAVGFAVYTDALERLDADRRTARESDWLNIALPKGRLGENVYAMFAEAGFECPSILESNRKLVFENAEKRVRYFWVKPSDVAIYVERGAADVGVAGKDILLEYEPNVYELLKLNTGICRMAVAAPKGFADDASATLRVATKFSNIARTYYQSKGREIDIIHLNGSIELAPILHLSDVIVDIVETGTTLRENNLEVIEEIVPISARLIANKTAYKFKGDAIRALTNGFTDGGGA